MRIAVLDDDPAQADFVCAALAAAGHVCHRFAEGNVLVDRLRCETFDLLVLDWNVPGMSGAEVLRWARETLAERVPVLFLTTCGSEAEMATIFGLGADDYIVKPVHAKVLRARIASLLRCACRIGACEGSETFGRFAFDARTRQVSANGEPVSLSPPEFDLALLLFRHLGRPLARAHIQEAVVRDSPSASLRMLDTHMSMIRTKLDLRPENGYRLAPIHGFGYRLDRIENEKP
jgi:DNA-binding response OmpR family regulator